MNKDSANHYSNTFIYAFVNLRKDRTEYYLVPSKIVANNIKISKPSKTRKSIWYSFYIDHAKKYEDNWNIFK